MGAGLVIIEPTTLIRDWIRADLLEMDEVWAGGWPQTSDATTGVVMTPITSTLNGPITTWSMQFDVYAPTQPAAADLAADLATELVRAATRTVIGTNDIGSVLYGGAIEGSVNLFPTPEDDPDTYRHTLLIDLLTIAVSTPTP